MYNPGSFQTVASVLGLGPNDTAFWLYMGSHLVSYRPLIFLKLGPADFQRQTSSWYRSLGQGVSNIGLDPLTPQGWPPCLESSSFLWVAVPGVWLHCILPLPPLSMWSSFYVSSCGTSVLPGFISFSEWDAQCAVCSLDMSVGGG